jgi:hypothetical protein
MEAEQITKRKRTQKTSHNQYEQYLQFMKGDAVFRSGTINPTVNPDYVQEKWKRLTAALNSEGNGPVLTCEEWKKVSSIFIVLTFIIIE